MLVMSPRVIEIAQLFPGGLFDSKRRLLQFWALGPGPYGEVCRHFFSKS